MAVELRQCPHCGGEIEGIAIWQNKENEALHFEMDHGDMACHFDLEFSPAFLDMSLDRLFGIFQKIAERRADRGLPGQPPARRRRGGVAGL
jgi:hypothetical protein